MHLVPMILNIPLMSSSRQNRNDCVIPFGCQTGKRMSVSNLSGVLLTSRLSMLQGLLEKLKRPVVELELGPSPKQLVKAKVDVTPAKVDVTSQEPFQGCDACFTLQSQKLNE